MSVVACAMLLSGGVAFAAQSDNAQQPAPIVRVPPKPAQPASSGSAPAVPKPHLTDSYPVTHPPQTPGATATKPAPKLPTAANSSVTTAKPTTAASAAKPPALPAAPTPGPFNRGVVVLDAAHGGADTGSRITDSVTEKDITLALANRIRSLLAARGFSVVMTRETDEALPDATLKLDDRAGIANRARPLACLLLHATASGSGVHLYTSELDAIDAEPALTPWLTAQAAWVPQSQRLATQLGTAMGRAHIPLVTSRASVRPVDSLTCPGLVLELAPEGGDAATLSDGGYQQRVAEAVANALVFWQNQAQPPPRLAPPAPPPAAARAVAPTTTGGATP